MAFMSNHAIHDFSRNSVKSGGGREGGREGKGGGGRGVKYVFLSLRRQLRCQAEGKNTGKIVFLFGHIFEQNSGNERLFLISLDSFSICAVPSILVILLSSDASHIGRLSRLRLLPRFGFLSQLGLQSRLGFPCAIILIMNMICFLRQNPPAKKTGQIVLLCCRRLRLKKLHFYLDFGAKSSKIRNF
jgi:hypothetical protein